MSLIIKETIEIIYRFITLLAKVPLARRFILSNKYEYDYEILAPLAMTSVPHSKILNLPQLPKEDELPNQKWLTLVLSVISILTQKKSADFISESVSNDNKINLLESIHEQIKVAEGQEELTNAVLKLKSALMSGDLGERKVFPKPKNDIKSESNFSKVEDKFDEIDREIQAWVRQTIIKSPASSLKNDEGEQVEETEDVDKKLYEQLQDIIKFLGRELIDNQTVVKDKIKSNATAPTLEDYENLIKPLNIKSTTLSNFQQDKIFAYMQVAGANPVMLKQIKKLDERLLITNDQYQGIVPQDSLEAALQEGRLYLADYAKLSNLSPGNFAEIQKYMYAPVALFAVPSDKYPDRNLLPIAIRCQQAPGDDNPIFTPLNRSNWMTAKTVLQMADSNYHELISHLAQTHLFIEPFIVATNYCFTEADHPVRLLLKPHLEGTILINYGAYKRLLAKGGPIDSLLSGTIDSNCKLAIEEAKNHLVNLNEAALPRSLEKRGVNNSKQLPIYPYRDDGQRIWNAIYQWVGEYLRLFYRSNESVETDQQLQNWAHKLFHDGKCHVGEDADGRITTIDYLVEAISTIIFTASAQHAAVNFPQSGLMTYVPAFPLGCYSSAPTQPQQPQNFMRLLPTLERAELQIQVLYLLGSVYYTKLGDYFGSSFQNPQVKRALDRFKIQLTEIEQVIRHEDSQRLVSYRYLLPSQIPQSINI